MLQNTAPTVARAFSAAEFGEIIVPTWKRGRGRVTEGGGLEGVERVGLKGKAITRIRRISISILDLGHPEHGASALVPFEGHGTSGPVPQQHRRAETRVARAFARGEEGAEHLGQRTAHHPPRRA